MTESIVAEGAIEVGHHETAVWPLVGEVNIDTITSTAIAAVIVIALALFLRAKVTSSGVPGGVQLFFEAITIQMRNQIEGAIGMKIAPFVLPLAVTIFIFILVCNWLSVLPVQYADEHGIHELISSAAADINFVLALALLVFCGYHLVEASGGAASSATRCGCSRATSRSWRRSTWSKKSPSRSRCLCVCSATSSPHGILVSLIALLGPVFMVAPNAIWKTFDLFVGLIQAFIFALLTILYFSQAMELEEDHH